MRNVKNVRCAAVLVLSLVWLGTGCGGTGDAAHPPEEAPLAAKPLEEASQAVSNVPGTCPGAVGSNCAGLPGGFCSNSSTTPGWVSCPVAVGSQMHDTCCGAYPGGVMCGGSPAQYCTPPANSGYGTPYRCCKAEWDRAEWDMAQGRTWEWGFNESVVAPPGYRMASTAVLNGKVTAYPTANSLYPKPGSRVTKEDAALGWCRNGIRSQGLTEAICN